MGQTPDQITKTADAAMAKVLQHLAEQLQSLVGGRALTLPEPSPEVRPVEVLGRSRGLGEQALECDALPRGVRGVAEFGEEVQDLCVPPERALFDEDGAEGRGH